jgi:DNA-binding NarL/FixJ family response regulator
MMLEIRSDNRQAKPGASIRIVIGDDHYMVRRGLKALLEKEPGCEVVAEAETGREVVEKTLSLQPDVTIVDIRMPELNGLDATRQIRERTSKTHVVVLTLDDSDALIRELLRAGAIGYMLKTDAASDLVAAIRSVAEGRPFFTPSVARMVVQGYLEAGSPSSATDQLTPREREVVQLLAEGRSNKEVAQTLGISVKTAETHRAHIMRSLNLGSICDLVHFAVRENIIEA